MDETLVAADIPYGVVIASSTQDDTHSDEFILFFVWSVKSSIRTGATRSSHNRQPCTDTEEGNYKCIAGCREVRCGGEKFKNGTRRGLGSFRAEAREGSPKKQPITGGICKAGPL